MPSISANACGLAFGAGRRGSRARDERSADVGSRPPLPVFLRIQSRDEEATSLCAKAFEGPNRSLLAVNDFVIGSHQTGPHV
jgi:hypothetical protein